MSTTFFPTNNPCHRDNVYAYYDRVKQLVSDQRFEHIERVTILAERIAKSNKFSEDELSATCLAAILHDAARDLDAQRMFDLAPPQTNLEKNHPLSLHGRAGRKLAECWGIHDRRILEAIEGHVFGVTHSNRIGMAVYIADVSEPGRGVNQDIRELAMTNLFRAYQRAMDSKVRYLQSKGKPVHPTTLRVYKEICELS